MEIKETIGWLCKLLTLLEFPRVTPEDFRCGKFNKKEGFEPLRLLLEELITTVEGKRKDGRTRRKMQCETKSDYQQNVQVRLMQLGYPTPPSYQTKECLLKGESREILLAIGWLLAVHSPLENVIRSLISSSVAGCEDSLCIRQENNDEDQVDDNLATVSHCYVKGQLQQLVWSIGHLKHTLLSLLSADHQRLSLLNKESQRLACRLVGNPEKL
ncbi:uncharacterized protein LOC106470980 isoform X2 [Limulus polyphemus]|uniref:Uncharacterized protein LOC106470980 isoform X2 n=1 Tax=Limulus polyphemus TaxID=6850 RepID=A0ABM1BR33_LIMPO|nr:uncharacterized protein LOC106470980 isoform X2 [Limulus polyphemus]